MHNPRAQASTALKRLMTEVGYPSIQIIPPLLIPILSWSLLWWASILVVSPVEQEDIQNPSIWGRHVCCRWVVLWRIAAYHIFFMIDGILTVWVFGFTTFRTSVWIGFLHMGSLGRWPWGYSVRGRCVHCDSDVPSRLPPVAPQSKTGQSALCLPTPTCGKYRERSDTDDLTWNFDPQDDFQASFASSKCIPERRRLYINLASTWGRSKPVRICFGAMVTRSIGREDLIECH